jgi:hypothetical protein
MSYGGFAPSEAVTLKTLDCDPLHPEGITLGRHDSTYRTDAERSTTPFMAVNRAIDSSRRNYVVLPGGRIEYKSEPIQIGEAYLPNQADSFGHGRQPNNIG